jgi:nitrate reductase NapD
MPGHAGPKCFSGIVVTTTADRIAQVAAALNTLPGVQVHHTEPERSRLIVVQEAGTIDGEVEGMQRMRALPGVVDASLVFHMVDDAAASA